MGWEKKVEGLYGRVVVLACGTALGKRHYEVAFRLSKVLVEREPLMNKHELGKYAWRCDMKTALGPWTAIDRAVAFRTVAEAKKYVTAYMRACEREGHLCPSMPSRLGEESVGRSARC